MKATYILIALVGLSTSTALAAPDAVYVTTDISSGVDKGSAETALLASDSALVYKCRIMKKERKGINAVAGEDVYLLSEPKGSENKVDAKRTVARGGTAFECKRQALNAKGNLSNY